MPGEVQLDGLKAFRRALGKIEPALQKELRGEFLKIGERVAAGARARVPQGKTGKARGSIRAGVSGNNAYVQGGKSTVPYYGWLDFGTRTPQKGNPRHVGPWRRSGVGPERGRFIYPSIDDNKQYIEQQGAEAMERVAEKVLPR